ncbi:MAG: hypothetical protein C4538_07040 [Nitrospiraceae bacterium]|nr:MAG: hypothetical protein C4538_07040 [Nitrospiraceae bacterium]
MNDKLSAQKSNTETASIHKSSQGGKKFEEPELKYIEPKLTKHGDATNITFSIPFSPIPN